MGIRGWGEPARAAFEPRTSPVGAGGSRTYRMGKGWQAFLWLVALGFAGAAVAAALLADGGAPLRVGLAAGFGAFAALGAVAAVAIRNVRVTIDDAGIEYVEWRKPRRLALDQLAGYRTLRTQNQTYLVLEPRERGAKKLKVPRMGSMDAAFGAWLARLPDLDAADLARSEAELLASRALGGTPVERRASLARARSFARAANGVAMAAAAWAMFYPRPYGWAVAAAFAVPLVAIAVLVSRPGVFQLLGARADARPHLVAAIFLPGTAGAVRAFDFDLLAPGQLVVPALVVGALVGGAALLGDPGLRRKPAWLLLFVPIFALQGAGALTVVNCFRDPSPPARYEAEVRSKHVSRGKTTTWHLGLGPWGPRARGEDVTVGRTLHDALAVGDRVEIRVREGRLGFPWFHVAGRCR